MLFRSLNPQGGTVSPTSVTATHNTAIGALPTPTRANYTFNGWFTAATGGTQYTASTLYDDITVTTLYAQWTASPTPTPPTPPTIPVSSVSIDGPATVSLEIGKTATLTVSILPTIATNKSVTWTSSNQAVATVSASGVITAVGAGTARITVTTANGSLTAYITITVTDPVSNDIVDDASFTAYPNPTSGPVTLTGITAGQQIRIYNLAGTQVATHTATTDGRMTIDLSALPRGTYILKTGTETVKVVRK